MYSSYHTLRVMDWAREAYSRGVSIEKRYGIIGNVGFQRAEALLMDIVVENDVSMPPSVYDAVEGLMSGDLSDVREAFHILGQYAQRGLENARWVERNRP